jgi:hypothetical protein
MTDAKFTPGPWAYIGEDDDDFVVYAGEQYVTNVGGERIRPVQFPVDGVVAFDVRDQANARLVAAAPDLYEVAKIALSYADEAMEAGGGLERCDIGLRVDYETCCAALAKARGETK